MENIALLLDVLLRLAGQTQAIASLIQKARAEGRDVSREELDALYANDNRARAELEVAIAARGG